LSELNVYPNVLASETNKPIVLSMICE